MRLIVGFAGILVFALPAVAQERISPEEFLDVVVGRTAKFVDYPGGALVGVEQFVSRTQTRWARSDGTCTYGEITTGDGKICFHYDDQPNHPHCWFPMRDETRYYVMHESWTSAQKLASIGDAPISCAEQPMS